MSRRVRTLHRRSAMHGWRSARSEVLRLDSGASQAPVEDELTGWSAFLHIEPATGASFHPSIGDVACDALRDRAAVVSQDPASLSISWIIDEAELVDAGIEADRTAEAILQSLGSYAFGYVMGPVVDRLRAPEDLVGEDAEVATFERARSARH